MTDKKDIINPDEDFELDGLSEFVEDLNKDTNKVSSVKDETVSDNSNEEDIPSFLNDSNNDFNIDDLTSSFSDDSDFDSSDNIDSNLSDFAEPASDVLEENKNLSEEDNISSAEFNNLTESAQDSESVNSDLNSTDTDFDLADFDFNEDDNSNDFANTSQTSVDSNISSVDENDLDLTGIKEIEVNDLDSDLDSDLGDINWGNNEETDTNTDIGNKDSLLDDGFDSLISDFEIDDNSGSKNEVNDSNDDLTSNFNNFDDLDNQNVFDNNLDNETSLSDSADNLESFDFNEEPALKDVNDLNDSFDEPSSSSYASDLQEEWGNSNRADEEFNTESVNSLLDDPENENQDADAALVPVPVKTSFGDKIKNLFKKNKNSDSEEDDSNTLSSNNLSSNNLGSSLNDSDDTDDIEEQQNKEARKSNIIKLSLLAVIVAGAVGGGYWYTTNNNLDNELLDSGVDVVEAPVKVNKVTNASNNNQVTGLDNQISSVQPVSSGISSTQIADLKKELQMQIDANKTAYDQKLSALQAENDVLKKVINEVQTSIDPDMINRFKIEFNDLSSKTKQLEVRFDDDQSANKVMATNFFAVVKKLNEDVQNISATSARQDSLNEQTKRIDNSFKQMIKIKDKAAEDNLAYRVDLIEKRMKFRNPNEDRTFDDKNNVRKVLSEGLFEGDTVKQEQPIPDVKYKYGFVGMIEGTIYLKNQSGVPKDYKVGDVLPGYGEVLKINENGSVETEKFGTVNFR